MGKSQYIEFISLTVDNLLCKKESQQSGSHNTPGYLQSIVFIVLFKLSFLTAVVKS